MSSTLSGSSLIWRFKHSNAIKIHDGITFYFYTGLPQMENISNDHFFNCAKLLLLVILNSVTCGCSLSLEIFTESSSLSFQKHSAFLLSLASFPGLGESLGTRLIILWFSATTIYLTISPCHQLHGVAL